MIKKLLPLLLLILIRCSDEPVKFEDLRLNINDLKYYSRITNEPYSGKVVSIYDNGNLRENGFLKEGKLEGEYEYYYSNGNIFEFIIYKSGKPQKSTRYHINGEIRSEGFFQDGELHGILKIYDENGVLIEERTYKDGEIINTKSN